MHYCGHMLSTGNDSRSTYISHSKPTCPEPLKIGLTINTEQPQQMASHRMLFVFGRDSSLPPFYHLIVTLWFPVSSCQMSFLWGSPRYQSPANDLLSPLLKYLGSWERLRRRSLVVTSFLAVAKVTGGCQIRANNWSIRKLQYWQATTPLKASEKMVARENKFIPSLRQLFFLWIYPKWIPQIW